MSGDPYDKPSFETKADSARSKLYGGAIVEVRNLEEAILAESAGAICVLVAATASPLGGTTALNKLIKEIKENVCIPVMARARVGHTQEAEALASMGCDFIEESEILAVADEEKFLDKNKLTVPCICGCRSLIEALKRVEEGAAMIRIQGDLSKPGDLAKTVKNVKSIFSDVRGLVVQPEDTLGEISNSTGLPLAIALETKKLKRLPVLAFAGGGIVNMNDALLLAGLGCEGVFVDSDIFDCESPYLEINSIVVALDHYMSGN